MTIHEKRFATKEELQAEIACAQTMWMVAHDKKQRGQELEISGVLAYAYSEQFNMIDPIDGLSKEDSEAIFASDLEFFGA